MKIAIENYDPSWPLIFADVAKRVRGAFGHRALRIDHIGSTSVPGLSAKDIIDVQVTVANLEFEDSFLAQLAKDGLAIVPEIVSDHVPAGRLADPKLWSKKYARSSAQGRRVHVHVRMAGNPNQRYALLFRDYLRASPDTAASYDLIKRALAARHADDVEAYYDVKDPVCDLIMDAAEKWASTIRWAPGPSDA